MDGRRPAPFGYFYVALIIIVGGALIVGFNYWHALQCVQSNGIGDFQDYIKAMESRILYAEAKVQSVLNLKIVFTFLISSLEIQC
jgi:hypothetical protein